MPRLTPGAGEPLERAVRAALAECGCAPTLAERTSRGWASVTFAGERHRLRLRLEGPAAAAAADAFAAGLDEREFRLRGHVLADIALARRDMHRGAVELSLEALTVEAA